MNNFIVYDFETSGRSVRFDQILQAGIIIFNNKFQELEKMNIKLKAHYARYCGYWRMWKKRTSTKKTASKEFPIMVRKSL